MFIFICLFVYLFILNLDFVYDSKYEITKQIKNNETDYMIEIGLENKEKALTLVKIIYFVRKVLNKKYLNEQDENLFWIFYIFNNLFFIGLILFNNYI